MNRIDHTAEPRQLCLVCGRRPAHIGWVCKGDHDRIRDQLAALPATVAALRHELVPARRPAGDRVALGRGGSPAPARLDVLSLTGPGSEDVEWQRARDALHPAVRRWSEDHTVTVELPGGCGVERRTITLWFRELVRGPSGAVELVTDDDQAGVVPPAEWLDMWVRRWRLHFGHHVPARSHPAPAADPAAAGFDAIANQVPGHPLTARLVTAATIVKAWRDWRQHQARTVLGIHGHRPVAQRPDDPVADEWAARYGEAAADPAITADVKYLLAWLDQACYSSLDLAEFAAELRALVAELDRAAGKRPDQQWLGRCPSTLVDEERDERRVCGAGLWQDPHASQVQCSRCRSTWSSNELLLLAREIRRVWPVDRRRKYHDAEKAVIVPPPCPGCAARLQVVWRDITAPADRLRWWQPVRLVCPHKCPEAARAA